MARKSLYYPELPCSLEDIPLKIQNDLSFFSAFSETPKKSFGLYLKVTWIACNLVVSIWNELATFKAGQLLSLD